MKTHKMKNITLKMEKSPFDQVTIKTPEDAYNCIRQFYFDDLELFESFFLMMTDKANKTIAYVKISQGGVSGTVVDPKIIAKYAIDSLCSGVILAHNHPSGMLKPSSDDIAIVRKITVGLKLFEIEVLDSLIIADKDYYSWKNEGIL